MINEECIKCGNNGASFEYHGHKSSVEEHGTLMGSKLVAVTELSTQETMLTTCNRCGYKWFQKPLDVQQRGELNV